MKREDAARVLDLALECSAKLNGLVAYLQTHLERDEYEKYRLAIGRVMGETLRQLINPVVEEHEDLRPPGLDPPKRRE